MKRYFGSFLITSLIYFALASGFYYLYSTTEIKNKKDVSTKKISLNHVEIKSAPKKVEEVKKVVKEEIKKSKQEVMKKEVKIEKKKEKKKKRIVKKTINKKYTKKVVKKQNSKPVKENIKKVLEDTVEKKHTKETTQTNTKSFNKKTVNKDEEKEFLKKHLSQIRDLINKNIKYPKRARKLNIQGVVKVKFKLLKNGKLGSIEVLSGHKFLRKATIKAIKDASNNFPKTNVEIDINIPIDFILK